MLCTHYAKSGRQAWSRQCYYRGTTFVDGYLADATGAHRLLAGAVGAAALGVVAVAAFPRASTAAGVLGCLTAGAGARSCGATPRESVAVGVLSPAFGVLFGAGVVRGLRLAASST